jgi:group I intron endonuclease
MSCGIYKITNKVNGHSYIGQSVNIETRWVHHRNYKKNQSHYPLYIAFKKYGIENFDFEILELCSSQELDQKEIFWIDYYNTYVNGYNQTTGGQGTSNAIVKISSEDIKIIYDLLLNSTLEQKEIAKMFNVGEDTISEINQGKTRIDSNLIYPLRNHKREQKYCARCGKPIYYLATHCNQCTGFLHRYVDRPSREELKRLIRTMPFTTIGTQYGVTDNTIRKWCDNYKLPRSKREIKSYSDVEWDLI